MQNFTQRPRGTHAARTLHPSDALAARTPHLRGTPHIMRCFCGTFTARTRHIRCTHTAHRTSCDALAARHISCDALTRHARCTRHAPYSRHACCSHPIRGTYAAHTRHARGTLHIVRCPHSTPHIRERNNRERNTRGTHTMPLRYLRTPFAARITRSTPPARSTPSQHTLAARITCNTPPLATYPPTRSTPQHHHNTPNSTNLYNSWQAFRKFAMCVTLMLRSHQTKPHRKPSLHNTPQSITLHGERQDDVGIWRGVAIGAWNFRTMSAEPWNRTNLSFGVFPYLHPPK